jgi:hypothetical protein
LLYLSLLLLAFSANCGVLQGAVPILGWLFPGKSGKMDKQAELLVEVQESLLRFADEYSMRMVGGVDNLRRGTDALSPAEVLQLKIAIGSETWSIASGPNAVADLLDMTVFVTVMRMTLEDYWQPKVFGKSALPMLACPERRGGHLEARRQGVKARATDGFAPVDRGVAPPESAAGEPGRVAFAGFRFASRGARPERGQQTGQRVRSAQC